MIPVLGIPVLNRPDLLARCLASIDQPIDRLLLIDNSRDGEMGRAITQALPAREVIIARPPANLGFTASVNHVLRSFPRAPWWAIANADTEFSPGDLGRLAQAMGGGPRWVGVIDWRVFGLNRAALAAAGYWDENFFNYCSDADYEWRCHLAGVEMIRLPGASTHVGSVCYSGDAHYAAENARSYPLERAYYRAKWGGDLRGGETFASPFGRGGHVGDWRLDPAHLASIAWT